MKKPFWIYPTTEVAACKACPFQDGKGCTFTGGPKFKDKKPPAYIHEKCPKAQQS